MPTQGHRQTSEQVLAASAVVAVTTAVAVLRRRITPPPIKIHASDKLKPLLHRLPTLLRGHRPAPLVPTGMLQSATVDAYNPSPEATPWEREEIRLAAHQNGGRTPRDGSIQKRRGTEPGGRGANVRAARGKRWWP